MSGPLSLRHGSQKVDSVVGSPRVFSPSAQKRDWERDEKAIPTFHRQINPPPLSEQSKVSLNCSALHLRGGQDGGVDRLPSGGSSE